MFFRIVTFFVNKYFWFVFSPISGREKCTALFGYSTKFVYNVRSYKIPPACTRIARQSSCGSEHPRQPQEAERVMEIISQILFCYFSKIPQNARETLKRSNQRSKGAFPG